MVTVKKTASKDAKSAPLKRGLLKQPAASSDASQDGIESKIAEPSKSITEAIAAPPQKKSILERLFPPRRQPLGSQTIDVKQKVRAIGTDSKLSQELRKLNITSKKKRPKVDREMFSIRGLVRAINLQENLEKAGFEDTNPKTVGRDLLKINFIIFAIATLGLIINAVWQGLSIVSTLIFLVGLWVGGFFLVLAILWMFYLFYLDMKIYERTKEVEKVFPDFLQLASSNISAGMTIDKALWYAVRPNFGVLSKEIESIAKNTITGQELSAALADFARKYDSKIIQRSINLLLEGLAAGGELADLLSKIALNIEETRILKRDMAANVTTYVIFITFASIVAAPGLLGLSTQLLSIISKITSGLGASSGGSGSSGFSFNFSSDAISITNFRIFAYTMITISSIFAACIVNVIQKGRVRDGLSRIPIFIIVSAVIYTLSNIILGYFLSGLM